MRTFLRLMLVVMSLALAPAFALAEPFHPKVICQSGGNHGSNPDAVTEDVRLLEEALETIYPSLPPDLQAHAREVTVVANHAFLPATKLYLGWGPEDDPEYRYPDRTLFPKGTIKTNVSERFVQLLRFIRDELGGIRSNEEARAYVLGFFVHEFTHDLQYMGKPVRDLSSFKESKEICPDGLCDRTAIEETKLKIAYEDAAFSRQLAFVTDAQLTAFARDYAAVTGKQPERFQSGAAYGLLGPSFADYYLKILSAIRKAGGISGSAGVVYKGQYRVPELANELHDLIEKGPPSQAALQKIAAEWLAYTAQGNDTEKLRGFSYIALVERRFGVELSRALVQNSPKRK